MKTITIIGADAVVKNSATFAPFGSADHIITGPEEMSVSDGYHTFDELYDHRITLFIALLKQLKWSGSLDANAVIPVYDIWRSTQHSDGSIFPYWFIMGIGTDKGKQITYHIPLDRWSETEFAETLDRAPEWDGHTSADVLERLKSL